MTTIEQVNKTEGLLTVEEVAAMLRLTEGTVYQLVCRRRIPAIKLSRRALRFRKADIDNWISSKEISRMNQVSTLRKKKMSVACNSKIDRIILNAKAEVLVE